MRYVFVTPNGLLTRSVEAASPPSTVAPSKGRWLGIVEEKQPQFNPDTHYVVSAGAVVEDEYHVTWQRFPLDPEEVVRKNKQKRRVQAEQQVLTAPETKRVLEEDPAVVDARLATQTLAELAAEVRALVKLVGCLARAHYGRD